MAGEIPIKNIYYLLSYAWDYLPEAGEVDVLAEDAHSLDELFARVLTNGTSHLLRQGLDRDYILHREETSRLRGRFDLTASFSRQSMQLGRMICEFDDLSHNVLHNRILKTTLERLAPNPNLSKETRKLLHQQIQTLRPITSIRITSRVFRRIRLHRTNRQYRLLLNICELIHDSLLPTQLEGHSRFRDFIRDEKTMPRLFEAFIHNFYKRHTAFTVSAAQLKWNIDADQDAADLVPKMITDVSLYSPERQIILDCKFYKNAFKENYGKHRFNRDHLFQLFAYMENAGHHKGWHQVEGILLYPAVNHDFQHQITLNGHPLQFASIDLNQSWQEIEMQLLERLKPQTEATSSHT